ncbi:hypothetical protein D3P08_00455 [Paenibacillus nanensis]|uniref:HEAT repeat domain-containing protein n=1 Tax=Paenibacillus nanensis TaxID=393251 RepID=A0A3A1VGS1_9BACL|nr:hypothetical protein [Paenibacillus nanensis]RIX60099.1 hypothetical protein D3P08_00455 [Paenibacillus nanensis]
MTQNHKTYIESVNNDELIVIIHQLEDLDAVTTALTELSIRDQELVVPQCLRILEEDLGDEFLQAVAFHLYYELDNEKAKEIIIRKLKGASPALLGAIMESLSADSLQPFGKALSFEFLSAVVGRYLTLSEDDKTRIRDSYEWFKESYANKLT